MKFGSRAHLLFGPFCSDFMPGFFHVNRSVRLDFQALYTDFLSLRDAVHGAQDTIEIMKLTTG
jgi:hypothetical protein